MGNIGNLPGTGLGCNALTEWWLPGADAFGFAPENGWIWGASWYAENSGIPLLPAGIGACEEVATEYAGDCSKKDFGRRAARSGTHEPSAVHAGYAEIFRV